MGSCRRWPSMLTRSFADPEPAGRRRARGRRSRRAECSRHRGGDDVDACVTPRGRRPARRGSRRSPGRRAGGAIVAAPGSGSRAKRPGGCGWRGRRVPQRAGASRSSPSRRPGAQDADDRRAEVPVGRCRRRRLMTSATRQPLEVGGVGERDGACCMAEPRRPSTASPTAARRQGTVNGTAVPPVADPQACSLGQGGVRRTPMAATGRQDGARRRCVADAVAVRTGPGWTVAPGGRLGGGGHRTVADGHAAEGGHHLGWLRRGRPACRGGGGSVDASATPTKPRRLRDRDGGAAVACVSRCRAG